MKKLALTLAMVLVPLVCFAWDGETIIETIYDVDNVSGREFVRTVKFVAIEQAILVLEENPIDTDRARFASRVIRGMINDNQLACVVAAHDDIYTIMQTNTMPTEAQIRTAMVELMAVGAVALNRDIMRN